MDMFDFAGLLFGGNRNRTEATTVTASGAASSEDGVASITLDADVTPAEDVGEDADQTIIDLPTSPDVDEGDEVIVTLVGDGPLKTPIVTANPGAGDRMRALANSAKTIANAAQAVAEAVGQHFWSADDGIHVTEATQEDWDVNHSGANVLINSIGQLFRDGLNNLLTLTTENGARALTIWDGLGNAASNVVATFDKDGIGLVGGAFRLTSERVTEEYGDESNPTTSTEIRSTINTEASNDSYATRCFLRSGLTEGDAAGGGFWELASETDINPEFPTDTKNASVEVGSDPWGSSIRLVADSQELSLSKNPMDNKDYFTLTSEVFLLTDYHNGVNMWSTVPGTVLWSGAYYMTSNHTATLAYNISTCPTGIVLHFQPYSGSTTQNYFHQYCFVPKTAVSDYSGSVHNFTLCNSGFAKVGIKALRIYDNRIVGDDSNDDTGTASGITFDNKYWVMTQVIAV